MGKFIIGVKSIIIYNRKVLLVQRSDSKDWECPGGKVEFGEDLKDALRREIKEETGLEDIRIKKLVYAITFIAPENQLIGLMYISYANGDKITLSPDEHIDFMWANKEQLINLLYKPMLNELIENNVLDTLEID
jgi:8-oxo-dGTP diphosphatase